MVQFQTIYASPSCWCRDAINLRARARLSYGSTASFSFEVNRQIHSPDMPPRLKVSWRYAIAFSRVCMCSRARTNSHTPASSAVCLFTPSRLNDLYTGERRMSYGVSVACGPVAIGGCTAGVGSAVYLHARGRLVSLRTWTSRPSPFSGPAGGGIADTTRVGN